MPLAYYIYYFIGKTENGDKNNAILAANRKNIEGAMMLLSTIPILCMYPYVVRYIKGGLQLGSVKG